MNSLPKKLFGQLKQSLGGCFFWLIALAFLFGGCGVFSFLATHVDCVGGYVLLAIPMVLLGVASKRGWRVEF